MRQITVVGKPEEDLMAGVTMTLAVETINIETIDLEEVDQTPVLTLSVDRYDDALQALQEAGFDAVTGRLNANQPHAGVIDEIGKHADGV